MLGLEDFITAVSAESKVHVCIHDVSGITRCEPFCISAARKIHASYFCECAKSLKKGLRLCMRCRALADAKAEREAKPFWGKCPFGVTEIAYPVVLEERTLCVVYIGLLAEDWNAVREKIMRTAALLKSPSKAVVEAMECLQPCAEIGKYKMLAQAIGEHILLLYGVYGARRAADGYHEVVAAAAEYADACYRKEISIEDIAKRYGMNGQYVGRLFKEQTKESFCGYLNRIRISHAKQLLGGTPAPVIEVALECGYNNVTYFNRVFKRAEGISPVEYRKKYFDRR